MPGACGGHRRRRATPGATGRNRRVGVLCHQVRGEFQLHRHGRHVHGGLPDRCETQCPNIGGTCTDSKASLCPADQRLLTVRMSLLPTPTSAQRSARPLPLRRRRRRPRRSRRPTPPFRTVPDVWTRRNHVRQLCRRGVLCRPVVPGGAVLWHRCVQSEFRRPCADVVIRGTRAARVTDRHRRRGPGATPTRAVVAARRVRSLPRAIGRRRRAPLTGYGGRLGYCRRHDEAPSFGPRHRC